MAPPRLLCVVVDTLPSIQVRTRLEHNVPRRRLIIERGERIKSEGLEQSAAATHLRPWVGGFRGAALGVDRRDLISVGCAELHRGCKQLEGEHVDLREKRRGYYSCARNAFQSDGG